MSSLVTLPDALPRKHFSFRSCANPSERRWSALLLLSALCALLFFYGLNTGDLYRTESLRAIIAAEFLRSGNWLVPTLYGEPLFTKPPGMYVAIALCSWPAGQVTEWSARLPSALAATATVFLFYWYFGRLFGRRGGLIAAVILPLSLMWLDKAPSAEIDMVQVAWVSASILFFLRALEKESEQSPSHPVTRSPGRSGPLLWWLGSLLCVAGGFLTKWTAPAFFYLTLVPLLWWRGQLRLLWSRPHVVSLAVAAGLCLAWITAAIALTSWDVFCATVSREALMRLSPQHHHRPYPWGESLAQPWIILAANLPWSVFAILTLWPGFAGSFDERGQRLLQTLHCWAWPNLLFWTVTPEHSIRHCTPLFPAIAGLAALVWIKPVSKSEGPCSNQAGFPYALIKSKALVAFVALWLAIKLFFVHVVIPDRTDHRQTRLKGETLAALVPTDATLYLSQLKDEGLMFYYGRPVRRLSSLSQVLSPPEPMYCILTEQEWQQWDAKPLAEIVSWPHDGQGDPLVLVRVMREQP